MAHDPTRAWPLGIGPDQTAIPGAAWLELLDGQAFPVVGAGVMVRDGNAWTPASSNNPLHTRDAVLASLIGALNAAKETNPDAASASMLALLRGMLATFGKETTLAAVKAAAESLAQEDFATETTLAALLSAVGNLATEATLSGVKMAVDTLAGTVADGAQKVTLKGSVQELTVVQGLALTDTSYTLENIDVSMFRQWDFRVLSTLNQRVRLKLYAGSTAVFNTGFRYAYLDDNGEVSSKSLELTVPWTISVQDRSGSLGSQVPEVFHAPVNPITTLSLRILADTAPTSGSISIYIRGVKS